MAGENLAVIDVGSNSLRCMIARVKDQSVEILEKKLTSTRLARGMTKNKNLENDSMDNSLEVLKKYRRLIDKYEARLSRAVGTSALRNAKNSNLFLEKVKKETGVGIEIISGTEEAFLSARGALFDKNNVDLYLVFDLGGGSLELISKEPEFVKSLEVGAVNLLEQAKNTRDGIDLDKLALIVENSLRDEINYNDKRIKDKKYLVGVGGTATSFPAINQGMESYDGNKVQDYYLEKERIYELTTWLDGMPISDRKKVKGMPKNREEIIVPGGGIIYALLEHLGYQGYYASDRGLMYGILYEEIKKRK